MEKDNDRQLVSPRWSTRNILFILNSCSPPNPLCLLCLVSLGSHGGLWPRKLTCPDWGELEQQGEAGHLHGHPDRAVNKQKLHFLSLAASTHTFPERLLTFMASRTIWWLKMKTEKRLLWKWRKENCIISSLNQD